ncbi:MAG: type 1 glutamine amidotransferase [Caulobacteraceae bacterium]
MKTIGILETGAPPAALRERFGLYGQMFESLLGEANFAWRNYDVCNGALPERPEDCDGYLITGSAAGVYDPEPWIGATRDFLVAAKEKAALVGVCFGHQLMAEAFGGKVIKSPKGWGLGLHRYDVHARARWMDAAASFAAAASHQDQVVELPPSARVLAGSDFCPLGMLAYDDQPAISLQLHPEFDPGYAISLLEARRGTRYGVDEADAAIASYDQPDDRVRLGGWMSRFLAQ